MTSYSSILIDFIKPLLNGRESEADFLQKAQAGMMAWNHVVSDENNLHLEEELMEMYRQLTTASPKAKDQVNSLVLRKLQYFGKHQQLIIRVESRIKQQGNRTLYVESIEADAFRQLIRT